MAFTNILKSTTRRIWVGFKGLIERRRRIEKVLFVFIIFSSPASIIAQESDFGNWLIYIGNYQINEKWNLHHEIQYRNYDAIGDLEQLLLRTGIGYNLSSNNDNILIGYGFIASENYIGSTNMKDAVGEHRIFQQFITKGKLGILKLNHRFRFEQRFIEGDFKMRLRYFLGLNIPFAIKESNEYRWYASIYNELFINTQDEAFDRNRVYAGIGLKVSEALRFELGYMNQFLNESSRDQLNIITFFNF